MKKSIVSVVRVKPETVLEDIHRLSELAGMKECLDIQSPTILKGNISWHYPMPSANTTPWQLEAAIQSLQKEGFKEITAIENNTVVTNPYKGEKLNKYDSIFSKYNIPVKYNFDKKDISWEVYSPKSPMLILDRIYNNEIRIPSFFFGKNILHLPTVKCHIYTTTTGAMKNAFGGLLNTKRHYTHSHIHETLVDLLSIQKEIHSGIFTIMDGTNSGNGPGPRTLKPVETNIMLASGDSVAIDAISAKIMGFDPMKLKFISLANDRGLGNGKPENIELVGDDISDLELKFVVGDNFASRFGDLFWFSPLKVFQKLLFRTPLVYLFVFGSAFYHDHFWWNIKGKKVFNKWLDTQWGQLFQKY